MEYSEVLAELKKRQGGRLLVFGIGVPVGKARCDGHGLLGRNCMGLLEN